MPQNDFVLMSADVGLKNNFERNENWETVILK